MQKVSESQEQIDQALKTILLSTILGMLAVLIVVWFLAGWVYRPLGEMFRNILRLAQAEEDGQEKDELILAADALEDVNENMNFLKHQIRGNAVLRFLRQGKGDDGMDAGMFEFGTCHPTAFRVMVLRYYMEDWNKNEALTASISQIYEKTARSEEEGMHCYRAAQGEVILLFFREGQGRLDGEEEAAEILEELKRLYHIRGCVGISGCGTVDELPATYRRAELLTEYYILSRETEVVDERILREKKKGEVQEPEREHILRWVKEDTEKGPEEYLKKLLENLSAYRIQEAQKYLKELIADVIRLSENIGGEYEQYEKYLEDFLKNPVFVGQANLEEWLCQLFYQVKDQLKDGRQTTSARVMGEVVAYIEENYDSCGLSVESVAEKYGFSVSYFSKLFNSYTGKTFPDYMNQLRLAKARALLLECPELTIQEIAGRVGFNSSSYFSAAFRKYYGVTPSQIRKLKGH